MKVNCRIQSDIELADIEWFKDGQKIHESSNVKMGSGKAPVLMIFNADTNDGGKYVCKATNMAGIGLSNEAVVEIGGKMFNFYFKKLVAIGRDSINPLVSEYTIKFNFKNEIP